jgi:acyl carrier protein
MNANRTKLVELLSSVFLLEPGTFRFDMRRDEVETWDSLGVVSLAVGLQDTFSVHLAPEEALAIGSFQEVVDALTRRGVDLGVA